MNMRPVAFSYVYSDSLGNEEVFFHIHKERVPVRVEHLYSADQMAMAQETIKIEAALILKGCLNGDIYADRIRKIEILK